jgi:RNA polymerase sigma factor (sigma-70 family)
LHNVEEAVSLLPERCREVFLLHRVENLSYSQIATRCGISVSAVEKNIARACLLLGAAIGREEVSEVVRRP